MKRKSGLLVSSILFLCLAQTITTTVVPGQTDNNQRDLKISEGAVSSWPRKSKRYALVIGVDDYQDTQISKLTAASNDAKTLADALIEHSGFPADQVFLYSSDQPL